MKRKIVVRTSEVSIVAVIRSNGCALMRAEVERIRDQLADRLQDAVADLVYLKTPRNRVVVR